MAAEVAGMIATENTYRLNAETSDRSSSIKSGFAHGDTPRTDMRSQKSGSSQTTQNEKARAMAKMQKSKSVCMQGMPPGGEDTQFRIGGKPLICPRVVPLDLLFFRRIFSNLHRRYGNAAEEVPVAVFQRSVVRLFRVLGMESEFDAVEYDVDGSGAVGWFEFVTCWRRSKLSVVLSNAERVFLAMEDPGTCFVGVLLSSFLMFLIFANCTCFMLGTMPSMKHPEDGCPSCEPEVYEVFEKLETVCVAIFSLEYLVRLVIAPMSRDELLDYEKILEYVTEHEEIRLPKFSERLLRFLIAPMNIIDLFAIVPFYVEMLLGVVASNLTVLRVLRLTRLFRLVKLGRYFEVLQLVIRVFNKSLRVLNILLMYLILGVVFSSSVMFFFEGGNWNPDLREYIRTSHDGESTISPFRSIPHTSWWCVVTFTTVGYGDYVPVTAMGKLWATLTMLSGVLVLAMPISAISMNFSEVWHSWTEERRMEAEARMMDMESVAQALEGIESRNRLVLEVLDGGALGGEPEFLGEVVFLSLPVDSLEEVVQADELIPLRPNADKKTSPQCAGNLMVGWTWSPYPTPEGERAANLCGNLEVRVQRAEGLLGSDWKKGGRRDPFVSVNAWPKPPVESQGEVSAARCVTTTVSDTVDPVWNESLSFEFNWPRDWRPQLPLHVDRGVSHLWPVPTSQDVPTRSLRKSWSGVSSGVGYPWSKPSASPRSLEAEPASLNGGEETLSHSTSEKPQSQARNSIKQNSLTQVRKDVAMQGEELRRVSDRVDEMHGMLRRLETALLPQPQAPPSSLRGVGSAALESPLPPVNQPLSSCEPLPATGGAEPSVPGCVFEQSAS